MKATTQNTVLHTWFERDRQHVELRDRHDEETLIEWWDEEVTDAVEDGYLDPKGYHQSAVDYYNSIHHSNDPAY